MFDLRTCGYTKHYVHIKIKPLMTLLARKIIKYCTLFTHEKFILF